MSSLDGARVALLEGRMPSELAELVRRYGGEPYGVPAVRERPLDAGQEVAVFVDNLIGGSVPIVVCLTGVGVKTLFEGRGVARRRGRGPRPPLR